MSSTDSLPSPHEHSQPQFFISLVNTSPYVLTLTGYHTATACGWVQEPALGESILTGGERVWCGMPWDLAEPISLDLTLQTPSGERVSIHFSRHYPEPAKATLGLSGQLQGNADLQRADSSSPFLMITLQG